MQTRLEYLSWSKLFDEIDRYIKLQKKTIGLVFDEVQWIAKVRSGFVGSLKSAWLNLEANAHTRILICGSSNKFFNAYSGGEEQILRGLKTRLNIHIQPLGAPEIQEYYDLKLSEAELIFIQMLFGGIPYYLNQINFEVPQLKALNKALFESTTIFLDEVDEILRLEFNKAGTITVKKILSIIGMRGKSLQQIVDKSRLPYATVDALINKLVEYQILEERTSYFSPQKTNRRGTLFFINDFYLNFYFSVLLPLRKKIFRNFNNEFILDKLLSKKGYYISGYTGEAFEMFVMQILRGYFYHDKEPAIISLLHLEGQNFEVSSNWDSDLQIDILVTEATDRAIRLIECKWTVDSRLILDAIDSIKAKSLLVEKKVEKTLPTIPVVVAPVHKYSAAVIAKAKELGVILISGADLIS